MNELDALIHYRSHIARIFNYEPLTLNMISKHILSVVALPDDELQSLDTEYLIFLREWATNIQEQLVLRFHQ